MCQINQLNLINLIVSIKKKIVSQKSQLVPPTCLRNLANLIKTDKKISYSLVGLMELDSILHNFGDHTIYIHIILYITYIDKVATESI